MSGEPHTLSLHRSKHGLDFASLFAILDRSIQGFNDTRTGKNLTYTMQDIGRSAFAVFFTQSPSFLAFQTLVQEARGKNNATTIFGIEKIPTDSQIRRILDEVDPASVFPVFSSIENRLKISGLLDQFRFLKGQLLIAFDATGHFSSETIHCDQCSTIRHRDGNVTFLHKTITPVIVCPGLDKVINLAPEFIIPQDGATKQDCEINAMQRWLEKNGDLYSQEKVTILGDDLYAHQPNIVRILANNLNYIFTCKEPSHKYLYECVSLISSSQGLKTLSETKFSAGKKYTYSYRFINDVPLRRENFQSTNWAEVIITDENGKKVFKTACITNHSISKDNVAYVIQAHRCRWKIENENNNTLKTKGYNLEHNFGHGKKNLTSLLLTLNLLAHLFHTVLHLIDEKYACLRKALGRRMTFFQHIRALTCYHVFTDWHDLLQYMIDGLENKHIPP